MGFPFVVPEGVTPQQMWEWLSENRVSVWWSAWIKIWIAKDGLDSPEQTHHQAYGNSPEQALYMRMVQYMVVPMPKRRDVA